MTAHKIVQTHLHPKKEHHLTPLLHGKVMVITGAAGQIGRGMLTYLAQQGASLVLCDIVEPTHEAIAAFLKTNSQNAIYEITDITVPSAVSALVDKTVNTFGKLDIWVNNAQSRQTYFGKRVTELEPEEWDEVLNVDLKAPYLSAKYAIPKMIANGGGVIINIASVHALVAYPATPAYDAAKAGLIALTRQIAADFGSSGIRANAVIPGLTLERQTDGTLPDWSNPELLKAYAQRNSIPRIGSPQDVAKAVAYLASDQAEFITGTSLLVDGGMLARSPEWSIQ